MSDRDPARRGIAESLVGRGKELELIGSFLDAAAVEGGMLLLSGEAGVGKTVLLDAAAEAASMAGTLVLRAAGVEFEADVALAALNQLLLPLQREFEQLRTVHRDALLVALGCGEGPAPNRLVVCTATLLLLQQVAARRPLLVIVDDVQWLDRPSAVVLGFVARRLAGSRVGFIAASRSGAESFFERGGLPEHELHPLDDAAARQLVRMRFPTLAPRVLERLLTEAQGNPLALSTRLAKSLHLCSLRLLHGRFVMRMVTPAPLLLPGASQMDATSASGRKTSCPSMTSQMVRGPRRPAEISWAPSMRAPSVVVTDTGRPSRVRSFIVPGHSGRTSTPARSNSCIPSLPLPATRWQIASVEHGECVLAAHPPIAHRRSGRANYQIA